MPRSTRSAARTALVGAAPPFLAPEFFALARPFVAPAEALVAGAWSADGMIGALPVVLDDHHTLRALRSDHSPGYDYCGTPEGIAAIWRCLRDDDRWSELVLDRVPIDSPLVTLLPALARGDGCPAIVRPDSAHPFFALPDFEAHLKPKFRANLQRCARRAGEIVLERILQPSAEDLADAAAIEAMAWKASAGTAIANDARTVELYRAVAATFGARAQASLAFLRIGGRRVAALFVLEDRHTLYALKTGYDPAVASLGPGHLLIWKVAQDAEQRGLRELDFAGHEDEWKHRWTERVHDRRVVVIYRNSARGLVRYGLREVLKPHLPATVRESPRSPFPRHCQHGEVLGSHPLADRVRDQIASGFGVRSWFRRNLADARRTPPPRLGTPSRFAIGSFVRVRDAAAIHATLDARERLRGLAFTPAQWSTCGEVYEVAGHVRRLRDDRGLYRAVSATVLLDGVHCGSGSAEPAGCGRHCPLMFRDEWLEPAPTPAHATPRASRGRHARVRDASDIAAGLDLFGRRDGLTFMPEMAALAGRRFPIASRLTRVFEHDRWVEPRAPIYLLDGARCEGRICGDAGPCDRACALLWHADWLIIEDP